MSTPSHGATAGVDTAYASTCLRVNPTDCPEPVHPAHPKEPNRAPPPLFLTRLHPYPDWLPPTTPGTAAGNDYPTRLDQRGPR